MIAIVDGIIVQGNTDEILMFILKNTKTIDDTKRVLDDFIRQQKGFTEEEQALISKSIDSRSVNTGINLSDYFEGCADGTDCTNCPSRYEEETDNDIKVGCTKYDNINRWNKQ